MWECWRIIVTVCASTLQFPLSNKDSNLQDYGYIVPRAQIEQTTIRDLLGRTQDDSGRRGGAAAITRTAEHERRAPVERWMRVGNWNSHNNVLLLTTPIVCSTKLRDVIGGNHFTNMKQQT